MGSWSSDSAPDARWGWGLDVFNTTGTNTGDANGMLVLLNEIESSVRAPAGTTITNVYGLLTAATFLGATAAATVTNMTSLHVAAPAQIGGAAGVVSSSLYGLYLEAVSGTAFGSPATVYTLFSAGGAHYLNGTTTLAAVNQNDTPLTLQTGPSANAGNVLTVQNALLGEVARIDHTGIITSSNSVIAWEGQTPQVAIGYYHPASTTYAGASFGSAGDTVLFRIAAGLFASTAPLLIAEQADPAVQAGYAGLSVSSNGTARWVPPSGSVNDWPTQGWRQVPIIGLQTPKAVTGSWNYQQNSSAYFAGYITNNGSSANGDAVTFYDVWLDSGTWQLDLLGESGTNGALVFPTLVGPSGTISPTSSPTDQGQYAASSAALRTNFTGYAITIPGLYTLVCTINGRNASNTTGYIARVSGGILTRTA